MHKACCFMHREVWETHRKIYTGAPLPVLFTEAVPPGNICRILLRNISKKCGTMYRAPLVKKKMLDGYFYLISFISLFYASEL